ncbi:MAG TPA: SPW repeat protein [Thermomicrobiaceae bacterium]|nr:SPW repeat protein [Thermomicrobiaceae bacterium]
MADSRSTQATLASGVNVVAGIWLIVAPFVLGFSVMRDSMWNGIVVGSIVAVLAALRLWQTWTSTWLSWVNALLGAWMIASPWIYFHSNVTAVLWSDIVAGAVILVMAIWSALATSRWERAA